MISSKHGDYGMELSTGPSSIYATYTYNPYWSLNISKFYYVVSY